MELLRGLKLRIWPWQLVQTIAAPWPSDNNLYCWGLNAYGQLGNGTVGGISNEPVKIQTSGVLNGLTIKSAAVGGVHSCAIASDENLYCWGDNSSGQLGTGNATSSSVPILVGGSGTLSGRKIKMVSIGANQSCAIASDDKVYCWGKNNYGQLGNGSKSPTLSPIKVHTQNLPYLRKIFKKKLVCANRIEFICGNPPGLVL